MFGNFSNKHNRFKFINQQGGASRVSGPGNNAFGLGFKPPTQDEDITNKLFSIVQTGNFKDINEAIMSNSYDPKVFNENGESIVHILLNAVNSNLSTKNIVNILRLLKTHNVAMNNRDNKGIRPLHIVSKLQNNDLIKFFLKEDTTTDVNVSDINGQTPLHYAIKGKIIEIEPVDEPEEEEFDIPTSIGEPSNLEKKAYELKRDYIVNFFNKRGVFFDKSEYAKNIATFIIEGQRMKDEMKGIDYNQLKDNIINRLQILNKDNNADEKKKYFIFTEDYKIPNEYFNGLIFSLASIKPIPNIFHLGTLIENTSGDPTEDNEKLSNYISLSNALFNFNKMRNDLDSLIEKIINKITLLKSNFKKYGSTKNDKKKIIKEDVLYRISIYKTPEENKLHSMERQNNIFTAFSDQVANKIITEDESGKNIGSQNYRHHEDLLGYVLDHNFALKNLKIYTLFVDHERADNFKDVVLDKFCDYIFKQHSKDIEVTKDELNKYMKEKFDKIITTNFIRVNNKGDLKKEDQLLEGNIFELINDFIKELLSTRDGKKKDKADFIKVLNAKNITDKDPDTLAIKIIEKNKKNLKEQFTKIICDEMGFGSLKDEFIDNIKKHIPKFEDIFKRLANDDTIYYGNHDLFNLKEQIHKNFILADNTKLDISKVNNYNKHPKLSEIGTDIIRYVGLLINNMKNKPNKISISELIKDTLYSVVIICLYNSYDNPLETDTSIENKLAISKKLLTKFVLGDGNNDSILSLTKLLITTVDNKSFNDKIGIQTAITKPDSNYQTILNFYHDRTQSSPQNKLIESIIPFGKVTGMLTQPVDIKRMNEQLYNIQTKETVLRKIRDKERSTTKIFDIVTNVDMYTSDDNLFKVNKFLQVDPDLTKNLLKRKCNINAIDRYKKAPLHYAISYLGIDVINMLLEKNAYIFTPSGNSPYDFFIKSFENYCKSLANNRKINDESVDLPDKMHNPSELDYIGLWEPFLDAMSEENNKATLDVFKYLLEEFIRNINRHILFPGISYGGLNQINNFGIELDFNKFDNHHLIHKELTTNLLKIISLMKSTSWVRTNESDLKKLIGQFKDIYSVILHENIENVLNPPEYLELIGIINNIIDNTNTEIELVALYPDHGLIKDNKLVFISDSQTHKGTFSKISSNNTLELNGTSSKMQDSEKHLKLDKNNRYLYKITKEPIYKLFAYHDVIVKRYEDKDKYQIPDYDGDSLDKPKDEIMNKILNRIVKFTLINIIDAYIIDYDLCELFVSYLWNIRDEITSLPAAAPAAAAAKTQKADSDKIDELRTKIKDELRGNQQSDSIEKHHLREYLQQFGEQCIELFFYKNLTIEDINDDDPMLSLKSQEDSIIESIKIIFRNMENVKLDLSNNDHIIKKVKNHIFEKYRQIFFIFLKNLRKLFLHYINYIENQYKFLQIAERFLSKITKMNA